MKLAKLIAEHGPDLGLPELAVLLAADCARATTTNLAERCFVTFPQLVQLASVPTAAEPLAQKQPAPSPEKHPSSRGPI